MLAKASIINVKDAAARTERLQEILSVIQLSNELEEYIGIFDNLAAELRARVIIEGEFIE